MMRYGERPMRIVRPIGSSVPKSLSATVVPMTQTLVFSELVALGPELALRDA